MYWAASLASLAFLIVVHEWGHYFVARRCGMRIERFSIGFGPGILKRRSKKTGTVFQIAPIPFGGFVEIRGMNIAEEVEPDDQFAYPNRPAWQRFVTIFAGPATNYLSAIVIMFCLYAINGEHSPWKFFGVGQINQGYDAVGKLEDGDRILAIDDQPILAIGTYNGVTAKEGDSLTGRVNAKHGAPVKITVQRDGKQLDVMIRPKQAVAQLLADYRVPHDQIETLSSGMTALALQPKKHGTAELMDLLAYYQVDPAAARKLCELVDRPRADMPPLYLLGIVPTLQSDMVSVGVKESAKAAIEFPIDETVVITNGIWGIIARHEQADPRGPKGIFDEFAKAWKLGPRTGIELLAILSVYLGLFNLLPLPALDGGRLVFLGYEMVTRRRANPKIEAMVHMAGIMLLGVVMVLVTLRDFHVFS